MDQSPSHSPIGLGIEYSCSGSPNNSSNGNDSQSASASAVSAVAAATAAAAVAAAGLTATAGKSQMSKLDTSLVLGKCSDLPKRLCLVCGDIASGFHYGVASCEACKAFFKRTIQGNIEYSCPAQGDCEINKRRRKACQACRFQKCLRMGMLKEGVRLDRVRGGRQKYRRNGDSPYTVGSNGSQSSTSSTNNYLNLLNNMRTSQPNPLISTLLNCEPEPLLAGSALNQVDCKPFSSQSSNNMISILSDLVDKELVSTIVWAKQIPGFTDLVLNDQMRLLQSTWAEILALSISYRTQQAYNSNVSGGSSVVSSSSTSKSIVAPTKLVFAADFIMEQVDAIECRAEEMFAYCLQLQRRITPLAITKQEFVLLKALLLVNVDIELEDSESVEKLRNNLLGALQEAVAQGKPPFNALQHLNELLLCLPLLRQLDFIIRKYWNQVRLDNKTPMNKLFVEMLECNIAFN